MFNQNIIYQLFGFFLLTTGLCYAGENFIEKESPSMMKAQNSQEIISKALEVISELNLDPNALGETKVNVLSFHNKRIEEFKKKWEEEEDVNTLLRIGSIYCDNAFQTNQNPSISLFESAQWYLKALKAGSLKSIFSLSLAIENIADENKQLTEKMGGEEKVRVAVVKLFKLAAEGGNEEAQLAYEDRVERLSKL